jgi:hypothetical protein
MCLRREAEQRQAEPSPLIHDLLSKSVRVTGVKHFAEIDQSVQTMAIMGAAQVAMRFHEPVLVSGYHKLMAREFRIAADSPRDALELLRPLARAGRARAERSLESDCRQRSIRIEGVSLRASLTRPTHLDAASGIGAEAG